MNRTIVINNVEPATLFIRSPLGVNFDLQLTLQKQDKTPIDPTLAQFVMMPRSLGGTYPYDMTAYDINYGVARVQVPGTQMNDPLGYNIEVYARKPNSVAGDPPLPVGLLARGAVITEGAAYSSEGPMNMINVPVVVGPPGPQGPTGQRGSIWHTGVGDPIVFSGVLPGDMYLDESNGNVWKYDGTSNLWVRGTF